MLFFLQIIILTGEPMHSAWKFCALDTLIFSWKWSVHYALLPQLVTQEYESRNCLKTTTVIKLATKKHSIKKEVLPTPLLSESIMILCLLYSIWDLVEKHLCYQFNHYKKIQMIFVMQKSHHMQPPNQHFLLSARRSTTQKNVKQ